MPEAWPWGPDAGGSDRRQRSFACLSCPKWIGRRIVHCVALVSMMLRGPKLASELGGLR